MRELELDVSKARIKDFHNPGQAAPGEPTFLRIVVAPEKNKRFLRRRREYAQVGNSIPREGQNLHKDVAVDFNRVDLGATAVIIRDQVEYWEEIRKGRQGEHIGNWRKLA